MADFGGDADGLASPRHAAAPAMSFRPTRGLEGMTDSPEPWIEERPGRYVTLVHVGPYRSEREPDLAAARATLVRWAAERGLVYSHETDRGHALTCCVEHLRVGPVDDPDYTKWETEFAYLIEED
jgi:hypothetical protein